MCKQLLGCRPETVVMMRFGSHLYGTDTETSDLDYKGVYLPTVRQLMLGRIPKSQRFATNTTGEKNSPGDVDREVYSLHYFVRLACSGETVSLDMLHAPESMLIESSSIWRELVAGRSRFYTRDMRSFVHYARKQAAKYGVRGSRIDAMRRLIEVLSNASPDLRLGDVWNKLPTNEYLVKQVKNKQRIYIACNRELQATARVGYYVPILQRVLESYGDRARQAEQNQGIDWKAISHALRAAYQMRYIYRDNGFIYPLPEAPFLRDVKLGRFRYSDVATKLEDLLDEVDALAMNATHLPETCDTAYWDDWLYDTMLRAVQE